jgi:hypothetical protein
MDKNFINTYLHPPGSPGDDEQLVDGNPEFAEAGRADMKNITKGRIEWGTEMFTHSKRWGLIWRADFSEPERKIQIPPTRVVRWMTDDGGIGTLVSCGKNEKLELNR